MAALAARDPMVVEALVEEFAPKLSPAALNAAKAAAAIMTMNNIYYRFIWYLIARLQVASCEARMNA